MTFAGARNNRWAPSRSHGRRSDTSPHNQQNAPAVADRSLATLDPDRLDRPARSQACAGSARAGRKQGGRNRLGRGRRRPARTAWSAPALLSGAAGHCLRQQLELADVDLLREMVRSFAEMLMATDVDAVCGADDRAVSDARVNRRNGYRTRAARGPNRQRRVGACRGRQVDGHRETLGMDVITTEETVPAGPRFLAAWSPAASGVKLVTSDAHCGLKHTVAATCLGPAGSAAGPITPTFS